MKNIKSPSAFSLVTFLLYTMRGLFLWYIIKLVMYLANSVGFTLFYQKTPGMLFPVVFRSSAKGALRLPHTNFEWVFRIPEATGLVQAYTLPRKLLYLSSLTTILTYACTFFVIYLTIKMVKNARNGNFLISKNDIRLWSIAVLMIAMFIIGKVYLISSSMYFRGKLEFPGLDFTPINWYSFTNWSYIFFYLFLIIIAEAFRLGAKLKQENDLTI